MQKVRVWNYAKLVLLSVVFICSVPMQASAETSSSANYKATDTDFNAISSSESCSVQYCAKVTIGDTSMTDAEGGTVGLSFGPIVDGEPSIDVIIDAGPSDLGKLTTERTGSKIMKIKVRTYLSDGYIVQIVGSPPSFNGRGLKTLTKPTPSQEGIEQFGLNVVANTSPLIGENPLQSPAVQDGTSVIADEYRVANSYQFISGDTVARSLVASGQTDYTVSMIVNISGSTPAGQYSSDLSAIVTPLY